MTEPNKKYSNRSVGAARAAFLQIIRENGWDKRPLAKQPKAELYMMALPNGWLPHWMLKSDEIATTLSGSRLWDAAYQKADKGSVEGLIAVNIIDEIQAKCLSYNKIPIADETRVPHAIKELILSQALIKCLSFDGEGRVDVRRDVAGLSIRQAGEILPFRTPDEIRTELLKDYINSLPAVESAPTFEATNSHERN
jgi:hypothetical protein